MLIPLESTTVLPDVSSILQRESKPLLSVFELLEGDGEEDGTEEALADGVDPKYYTPGDSISIAGLDYEKEILKQKTVEELRSIIRLAQEELRERGARVS